MVDSSINPQALAEQSRIVRLPLNKIGSINKINKMYALLEQSNERPPSAEEIAKLDMTVNDVKRVYENSGRHLSMDAPLVEGKILTFTMYCVLVNLNPDRELFTNHCVLKLNVH
jgi:RNA polymerase primary sigma factor